MALLFVDGCSHYATNDITKKMGIGTATITDSHPRRAGSKSITTSSSIATPTLVPAGDYIVVGFAFYSDVPGFIVEIIGGNWPTSDEYMRLYLWQNTLTVYAAQGAGWVSLASFDPTDLIRYAEWYYLEFATRIHATEGTTEVRLNGISIPELTLTGQNTQRTSPTPNAIRSVRFGPHAQYTDIYADDATFHGDCIVETLYPTGAGYHAAWVPSAGANFENVDDLGDIDEDGTYNSSAVQGAKDSFETGNLLARPASTIKGVALHLTARKDWAGGRIVKPMLRVGGADYLPSAAGLSLSEVYHGKQDIWEVNPATGAAWSESGVNGAEIGYDLVTAT